MLQKNKFCIKLSKQPPERTRLDLQRRQRKSLPRASQCTSCAAEHFSQELVRHLTTTVYRSDDAVHEPVLVEKFISVLQGASHEQQSYRRKHEFVQAS